MYQSDTRAAYGYKSGGFMNKSELVEQLAVKKSIPYKQAEDVVNLIFSSMADALIRGDRIEIRGLGSFVIKEYGTYTGRNPKTGEPIKVSPKKLPFFKVGKELKEMILG
jgi:integration host factor subunit beta